MSSVAVLIPGHGTAPYFMSKAALDAYSNALRHEMMPFKVSVCTISPGGYKTAIVNCETVFADMDSHWEKANKNIQKQYGFGWLPKWKTSIGLGFSAFCSDQYNEVVDAYYHAITAKYPRKRYNVGLLAKFGFIPLSYLPTELQDLLYGFCLRVLTSVPLPQKCALS